MSGAEASIRSHATIAVSKEKGFWRDDALQQTLLQTAGAC